jgi:hypothetical protein
LSDWQQRRFAFEYRRRQKAPIAGSKEMGVERAKPAIRVAQFGLFFIVVGAVFAAERVRSAVDVEPSLADEAAYLAQNNATMANMMTDMTVEPTGDVDRDFVHMMIPHHQGAIDMAVEVLRYGRNEKVKRLAQEIIVTQQQEIAALRLAVGEPLPTSSASPSVSR